ncbi:hypothetical protein K525DRAFT_246539 [Schizophyllum commune Loenen D]|nr:hypothetical protein K525DRAFT_246539 [Schizophyllum commune Loenen D]
MASHITVLSEPSPAPEEPYDAETASENEEVDQLADAEEEVPSSPEVAKEFRLPGTSLFPSDVVDRVTQSHGATHTVGMSREASYVLSIATEDFIKRLVLGAYEEAQGERRNVINYHDVAATTQQYQELFFLQETIPQPMALTDALRASEQREKELMNEDPAIAPEAPADVPSTYISSGYASSKTRPPAAQGHPPAHQPHQPHPPSQAQTPIHTPSHQAHAASHQGHQAHTSSHSRATNGRAKHAEDDPYARRHPYREDVYQHAPAANQYPPTTNGTANGHALPPVPPPQQRTRPPVPLAPSASASPVPMPPHEYGAHGERGTGEPPSGASQEMQDQPYVPQAMDRRASRSSMGLDALMNPTTTEGFADVDHGRTIYSQDS